MKMKKMDDNSSIVFLLFFFFFFFFTTYHFTSALDTITPSQSLTDGEGPTTLVSAGGRFELGFFSPGRSTKRFLGIWYRNIPEKTVVWVANRNNPIDDSSGNLTLSSSGNLVLENITGVVWSTNTTVSGPTTVELLETGNLVIKNPNSPTTFLWQSFDYPTDTFLPEMKIGWDRKSGLNRYLTAWKSPDDPSPGGFRWGIERSSFPESVAWNNGKEVFRSGPWNGVRYSGAPEQRDNPIFSFHFEWTSDEVYYTYHLKNKSVLSRNVLNQTTLAWERYTWSDSTLTWRLYSTVPKDYCDGYGVCGPNSNCDMSMLPPCQCLIGFSPVSPGNWNFQQDFSQGCLRNKTLECGEKDGFRKLSGLKLPDTKLSWVDSKMAIEECRETCLKNCSCTAYTFSDIRGSGSGCAIWFNELMDIRHFPDGGQDLFIRMASSELGYQGTESKAKMKIVVAVVVAFAALVIVIITWLYFHKIKTKRLKGKTEEDTVLAESKHEKSKEDSELPTFDFATIAKATDNFSDENKLGEGGFGPVYKGLLVDGREIAVKRLSTSSGQGLKEFKNEVILIAELQHRNLVKLLGCSIEGEEKMLIYEYMPNRSLDSFIFDENKRYILDWPKRFDIICGIARGILYLHEDSRLRIIHRDVKASNVLLDHDMIPKISDFGMAKTFGGDQSEGNTNRVVGTYGYMAPEYAIDGLFSVKSDVFSFGILVLEIISGKKSRGVFRSSQNLIGHAWKLYSEGRPIELIDSCLEKSDSSSILSEVMRCIHVSFLCLQQQPEDRPSMGKVAVMLCGEGPLPRPKQPGFLIDRDKSYEGESSTSKDSRSVNELTVTLVEGR